jgi:hypothetical protein
VGDASFATNRGGELDDIVEKAAAAHMEPPTVIVVGEVVRLRSQLNWFERRPLFGKRILVTRPKPQAAEFSDLIAAQGGEPVECPTIEIVPPEDWAPLDRRTGSSVDLQLVDLHQCERGRSIHDQTVGDAT